MSHPNHERDYLLSLLDSQTAEIVALRKEVSASGRYQAMLLSQSDPATAMRDRCVAKVREYGDFHLSEMKYKARAGREDEANAHASRSVAADELASQLQSLTLEQEQEKSK